MNIHHVLSVSRWLLSRGSLIWAFGLQQLASGADVSKFRRIEPQFIAALGDSAATSGNGAQLWGIWNQDPGPRACMLDHYPQLKATGVAPAQWKFEARFWLSWGCRSLTRFPSTPDCSPCEWSGSRSKSDTASGESTPPCLADRNTRRS